MTLYRQLLIVILFGADFLLLATLWIGIKTARDAMVVQLHSHAQDTATSLGLSLSAAAPRHDLATSTAMIDAIFDRGYYRRIELRSVEGDVRVLRELPVRAYGVPDWFVAWLPLDTPAAEALVMSGWTQSGVITVASHPGYAYLQLWNTAQRLFGLFVVASVLAILAGLLALHYLLRPLKTIQAQAEAVVRRDYPIADTLPRTRELRSVVLAMNRMVGKLHEIFDEHVRTAERLRQRAFIDAVTGLGNRAYFLDQLDARMASPVEFHAGGLVLVRLHQLDRLNAREGFAAGDRLLADVAEALRRVAAGTAQAVVARVGGADFALLLPDVNVARMSEVAERVIEAFSALRSGAIAEAGVAINAGVTPVHAADAPGELMAAADRALRKAAEQGADRWALDGGNRPVPGRQEWAGGVRELIGQGQLLLVAQPVRWLASEAVYHRELLLRGAGETGALYGAATILAVAEDQGVLAEVDRHVIGEATRQLGKDPAAAPLAVNVAVSSLEDERFVAWLLQHLREARGIEGRLSLEFSERELLPIMDQLRPILDTLRSIGVGFGLDHFGRSFADFGYLKTLKPDYVKLDGGYLPGICEDADRQFFVRSLTSIAHSLDIALIAEAVSDKVQIERLRELHVDGVQGHAVARPHPF